MARLTHRLKQRHFVVTAEVDPPKGPDVQKTLEGCAGSPTKWTRSTSLIAPWQMSE